MSNQQTSKGDAAGGPQPGASATVGGYSPHVLQRLVDKAAYFNAFSLPDAKDCDVTIRGQGSNGDCIGFRVNEDLHRLAVTVQPLTGDSGLKAANAVGESYGKFKHRWVLAPDDFVGAPGREPPPTPLDPSRSQRFIMTDGVCTFGDGKDGFRGFGAGVTFPMTTDGRTQLLAATVGTILEGFGSFKNHEEGTYVHCGSLSSEHGFTGNLLVRVMDSQGTLRTTGSLPVSRRQSFPEPDITYIVFRGQAVETDPVTPRVGPDGQFRGLKVVQGLRLIDLNSAVDDGPRSVARVGQIIGKITAHVDFNPTAPGGTALNPIPFTTFDELEFVDGAGLSIGGFSADSSEGRVFNIKVAGQAGIRFGGVGPVLNGTGPFQGMKGLMTDNSVVIFQPHVSASLYVLRLHDPGGRFRSTVAS
jgi:hypothetical protein